MSFSQAQSRGRLLRFLVENLGQEIDSGTPATNSYIAINSNSELVLSAGDGGSLGPFTKINGSNAYTTSSINIGSTDTPSYTLDVDGTFRAQGNTYLGDADADVTTITSQLTASEGAYFADLVGIGDSSPSYTLDVNGDIRVTDDLFVDDFARIDALRVGTTDTDPGDGNLYVEGNTTLGNADSDVTSITSQLTASEGGYFADRVGIGTTAPQHALDVNGSTGFRGNTTLGDAASDVTTVTSQLTASEGGYFADRVGIGTATPPRTLSVNGDVAMTGSLYRSAHEVGGFVGTYNNVGPNGSATNPIYSIGSDYLPNSTTLNNHYGVGYAYTNATFLTAYEGGSWGQYISSGGDARVFLASNSDGCSYMPILKKTQQPAFSAYADTNQTTVANVWMHLSGNIERFDVQSGYNTTTCQYTAEVTGKYLFTTSIRLDSVNDGNQYVWAKIVTANDTFYGDIWTYDPDRDGFATPSLTVITDMTAGDVADVWFKVYYSTAETQTENDGYCFFQGYMLG